MAAFASPLVPTARPLPVRLRGPLLLAAAPMVRPVSQQGTASMPGRVSARPGFARTKIQPPRPRPGPWQARPLLEARVAEALTTQRLLLLQAAAGYGKTSLLARQALALPDGMALAWISCDLGDSPLGLFQCLVSALEPFDLPWRVDPDALMAAAAGDGTPASRSRALRTMVAALINALDACDVPHGVIAVDDLHRVDHAEVYEFLDLLLERFTPRWTLAVATRHQPPIALSRLRALGEVTEFHLEDLRFERDETLSLLSHAGMDGATADALFERTQGWPVALRLALHTMTGPRAVPAAPLPLQARTLDRPMFEFLAAEVFDRMAPDLRQFLLQTSLLPELSAARCAALTGDPRAGQQLERVERAGLAVSVMAGPELTLRLHDLLRDALQQRLLRERPDEVAGLCARAAASEPDPGRRIDYLLRAGDPAATAQVLLETTDDLSLWYRAHPIPRLNGLPGTARALDRHADGVMRLTADQPNPLRAMAHTQCAIRALWQGRAELAQDALDSAQADARWLGHPPNVAGALNLGRALLAAHRGEHEAALAAARQLVDQHPPQRGLWSLAGNLFHAGRVAAVFDDALALDDFVRQLQALRGRVPAALDSLLLPLRAALAGLRGQRDQALSAWAEVVADEDRCDRLGLAVEGRLRLAAAHLAAGRHEAVRQLLGPLVARVDGDAGVGGLLMAPTALRQLAGAAAAGLLGTELAPVLARWAALLPSASAAAPAAAPTGVMPGGLSSRESEVLARMAAGDSNKLIARAFDLSPHTVKRHVANILDKLDLQSRGQAAAWYQQHGRSGRP